MAWSLRKEQKMKKLALILIILALPMIARADQHEKTKYEPVTADNLAWSVPESHGLLLEVSGDSLCYEEQWMHLLPSSSSVSDRSDEAIEIDRIKAPCLVDISYGGKGGHMYIIKMRILSEQLPRDQNGDIVVPAQTYE
jgi:hypothetical protein